jgi:hypothetical protein
MIAKILKAVQSTQSKYPNGLQQGADAVKKALNWLDRQPFGAEVKQLYRNISFNVTLGDFPEFGVANFGVSKTAGDTTLYASTAKSGRFPMSLNGALQRAQKTVSVKKGEAAQKAQAAKEAAEKARQLAEEAQRLSLEAARAAEQAEAEAATFESAVGSFASVR